MTRESDLEQRLAGMGSLVDEMGASMAEGLIRGIQQSDQVQKLMEVLAALQQRLDDDAKQDRLARIERLEKEVAAMKAGQHGTGEEGLEPPPPPRPPQAPPMPPANMPRNPALSSLPFGLSAEPTRPAMRIPIRRQRSRTAVRPTVIYRKDPRISAPAKTRSAQPEEENKDKTCSEPGCERLVRCRGLCSLHYQRIRYKERKIEKKQANDDPLPPPPPPKLRSTSASGRKDGGTRGVFALLYDEKGRRTLAGLINQMKFDRTDLVERLNQQFEGMPGVPLEEEDVLRAVHYHKLGDVLREREGAVICRYLVKQLGSMTKTAQKMKIDPQQLVTRVEELGLQDDVARVRNEFREQIMEHSFADRLDLALTREKYLKDLAIEEEVDESLRAEIQQQLDKLGSISDVARADRAIRDALALDEQRYSGMVRRYGLEEKLQSLASRSDSEEAT